MNNYQRSLVINDNHLKKSKSVKLQFTIIFIGKNVLIIFFTTQFIILSNIL